MLLRLFVIFIISEGRLVYCATQRIVVCLVHVVGSATSAQQARDLWSRTSGIANKNSLAKFDRQRLWNNHLILLLLKKGPSRNATDPITATAAADSITTPAASAQLRRRLS